LPAGFTGERSLCTSIYFLLPSGERSLFHRIKSDELWHYHAGSSLSIYVLADARMTIHKLGPNLLAGENFQIIIRANSWFGAVCNADDSFTLSGCTVSPGFDFQDFEMASRDLLLNAFPNYHKEIVELTKPD
jgi:predicted cupin superfamily sugar epimerase